MSRQIRRPQSIAQTVRDIQVGYGLSDVDELAGEIKEYWDVLLGRSAPPGDFGELTLAEIANAYYTRAMEIDALIHEAERDGGVFRGSQLYRFRTGELRDFIEAAKRAQELGSRRLTQAQLEFEFQKEAEGLRWSKG
jgi:hypothetical protein